MSSSSAAVCAVVDHVSGRRLVMIDLGPATARRIVKTVHCSRTHGASYELPRLPLLQRHLQ
jgi:hypothetical protein